MLPCFAKTNKKAEVTDGVSTSSSQKSSSYSSRLGKCFGNGVDVIQTVGGTLSRQHQLALSTVPWSNFSLLQNLWFSCWEHAVLERFVFVFVAGLASFLVANIPCERSSKEDAM